MFTFIAQAVTQNINVNWNTIAIIATILASAWGLARRISHLEFKVNLMWRVFEKRLNIKMENFEDSE